MLLFARPQLHARRRAHCIIGVSPVFSIPAKRRVLHATKARMESRTIRSGNDSPKRHGKVNQAPERPPVPFAEGSAFGASPIGSRQGYHPSEPHDDTER
jgi:hypothetical protein